MSGSRETVVSDKDDWRRIVASILLAKTAVATFAIAPFLVGGYIDHLKLSVVQASTALSIEIFALAISNACAYFWIHRVACRPWAQRFLLLLIALNIGCIFVPDNTILLMMRGLVGATEGALLALGFGLLGITRRPNRNFGLYFAISLSIGAINVRILPLFLETAGVAGLFVNLSIYAVIALLGSIWVQKARIGVGDERDRGEHKSTARFEISMLALLTLMVANYVYFVGQGGVWSFLERLGGQYAIDLVGIANALALSLFAGVAGGTVAGWLDLKLGRAIPMLAAIAMAIVSLVILLVNPTLGNFTIAACLFNFGNNMGHPYVLGFAAKIDRTSRLTVLSSALHTGGQATGPIIAGLVVVGGDFTNVLWLGMVAFVLTILFLVPVALTLRGRG